MTIPKHVAIIMDGAGRWAVSRGLERHAGHAEGIDTAHRIIGAAHRADVRYLTMLAFSVASWDRSREEVTGLMQLIVSFAERQRDYCVEHGIRVTVIGQLDDLHTPARRAIEQLMHDTSGGGSMVLNLAVSYGSQTEIALAARALAAQARAGLVLPEEIDAGLLHRHMSTHDIPPVDLLIRTGGERSLSDFLIYECANAELVFLSDMWPDFTPERFGAVLSDFARGRSIRPPAAFDIPPSKR